MTDMPGIVEEVSRLLAGAGHAQCVPLSRRKNAPPPAAGFRILTSADGSVYVTWATGGSRPHEATERERSEAFGNVNAYTDLLTAAGYRVQVEGTLWSTARILPEKSAATAGED